MDETTQIWHVQSICSDCLFASPLKNSLPWPIRKEKLKKHSRRLTSRGLHMTLPASNIMRPATKYTKTPYSNYVASKQGANYHLISLHHGLFNRAVAEGMKDLRSARGGTLHLRPDGGKSFVFSITRVWNIRLQLLHRSPLTELRHAAPLSTPRFLQDMLTVLLSPFLFTTRAGITQEESTQWPNSERGKPQKGQDALKSTKGNCFERERNGKKERAAKKTH